MFSNSRQLLSPDGQGGGPKKEFSRDAYVALVKVLHDPPPDISLSLAAGVCASNFFNNVTVAVQSGSLSPEEALNYIALKNPRTGENIFHELKLLPQLVEVVSRAIEDKIQRGQAIEHGALEPLRRYASMPHMIGASSSVAAYRALLVGATRFYTLSSGNGGPATEGNDPVSEVARLADPLRVSALKDPRVVASFIQEIGNIRAAPVLFEGIDKILLNLSRPSIVPSEVRRAALEAIERRCSREHRTAPLGTEVGILNRCYVSHELLRTLELSQDVQEVKLAANLLSQVLKEEVRDMRTSLDHVRLSSFSKHEYLMGHNGAIQRVTPKVVKLLAGAEGDANTVRLLREAGDSALTIGWGLLLGDAVAMSGKVLPSRVAVRLHQGLYRLFTTMA